ncbi:MAG TPA: hypothetical protein VGH94_00665 [Acidimicrobiales bacterium]
MPIQPILSGVPVGAGKVVPDDVGDLLDDPQAAATSASAAASTRITVARDRERF